MKKLLIFLVVTLCQSSVFASSKIETYIKSVGILGEGRVRVGVQHTIDEPQCPSAGFDVMTTYPYYKDILSLVLTAKATGNKVAIKTHGCTSSYPTTTFDDTGNSWIFIVE